jgi:integrase/recombinase XerD
MARRFELSLAVVRDLRVARRPATEDKVAAFKTDVLAGFVLARLTNNPRVL